MSVRSTESDSTIVFEGDGVALMRIFPQCGLVAVTRPTALHLFSLICRYNATVTKAGPKWSRFWPKIKQIERSITVMLVTSNGVWGQPIPISRMLDSSAYQSQPGVEFRCVADSGRRKTLTENVERELLSLYRAHLAAVVTKDKVLAIWEDEHPKIVSLLRSHGVLENLLEGNKCYNEQQVFSAAYDLLLKHGHDAVQGGDILNHEEWCINDALIFSGCIANSI